MPSQDSSIASRIVSWFMDFHRPLPWRLSKDPYHVLLAEVVFQQTRINQGLPYYYRLLEKYPDVYHLANANVGELLKLWQGLGYYSRAHNLLALAKVIVNQHNGIVPSDLKNLRALPGVGSYTAAAIAATAYNLPIPLIDGNVRRFLGRFLCIPHVNGSGDGDAIIISWQQRMLTFVQPSEFLQAIMEIGALICTPGLPDCVNCPVVSECCAVKKNKVAQFPLVKAKAKPQPLSIDYLIITPDQGGHFYMTQRPLSGLWKGLFEFPSSLEDGENKDERWTEMLSEHTLLFETRHQLTHKLIHARFYKFPPPAVIPEGWKAYTKKQVKMLPVSQLTAVFLSQSLLMGS